MAEPSYGIVFSEPGPDDSLGATRWAWLGLRIVAAADLSETSAYDRHSEDERYRKAADGDVDYLALQLGGRTATALDLRWENVPGERMLSLHVVGRTCGEGHEGALDAAREVGRRLAAIPSHVFAEPLTDPSDVARVLMPWTPHPEGMVAIRKRRLYATPQRPDARVPYYFAVQPWPWTPRPWTQLLQTLAEYSEPVMLSVGLEAIDVSPKFTQELEYHATNFSRLAREGDYRAGQLYGGRAKLTPDAFAIDAERIFREAVRRYRGRIFRIRVLLSSVEPISDGLAMLVGSTISPPDRDERSYVTRDVGGASFSVERPTTDEGRDRFIHNLFSLDHEPWRADPPFQGLPAPPTRNLREVCDVADAREAAAAFRLPIAVHGSVLRRF